MDTFFVRHCHFINYFLHDQVSKFVVFFGKNLRYCETPCVSIEVLSIDLQVSHLPQWFHLNCFGISLHYIASHAGVYATISLPFFKPALLLMLCFLMRKWFLGSVFASFNSSSTILLLLSRISEASPYNVMHPFEHIKWIHNRISHLL